MNMQDFIMNNGLRIGYGDFRGRVDEFIADMEAGLAGGESSMKMLPTYVSLDRLSQEPGRRVIAMDAGGTNLRVTLVRVDEKGGFETEYMEVYPMPGTKGAVSAESFFDTLAGYLEPIIDKSDRIGFCFSFACEMKPDLDGTILYMTKEVELTDVEGVSVCSSLRKALAKRGLKNDHHMALINDSVATLLGGKACAKGRDFDGYIGFILGTGTNCCYTEENKNIVKDAYLRDRSGVSLINMESGDYSRTPRNEIDKRFDSTTRNPGNQLHEKMISGAYQGSLLTEYIRAAADAGCFSAETGGKLAALETLQSKEIDEFCYYPYGKGKLAGLTENSEPDKQALYLLFDAFFERAAISSLVNLAAIMEKTGVGKNPLRPACVSAEGTTFYKSKLLHKKITYYMTAYVEEKMGIHAEFMRAENATISGTALAALLG